MKCPSCRNELIPRIVQDIEVDVCHGGCGGIWFDHLELKKVDEINEEAGELLLDIPYDKNLIVDHAQKRPCPKCDEIIMMRHFFGPKMEIEIDHCAKCGGHWLDMDELGKIRRLYKTEEERRKIAQEAFDKMFGEQLEEMRERSEDQLKVAGKIAKIFRFVCPKRYLPGKKQGGYF